MTGTSGMERAEDYYLDHNNGAYLLAGEFVDADANVPAIAGKVYLPFTARR